MFRLDSRRKPSFHALTSHLNGQSRPAVQPPKTEDRISEWLGCCPVVEAEKPRRRIQLSYSKPWHQQKPWAAQTLGEYFPSLVRLTKKCDCFPNSDEKVDEGVHLFILRIYKLYATHLKKDAQLFPCSKWWSWLLLLVLSNAQK